MFFLLTGTSTTGRKGGSMDTLETCFHSTKPYSGVSNQLTKMWCYRLLSSLISHWKEIKQFSLSQDWSWDLYLTAIKSQLQQSSSFLWIESRLQKWDILLFISPLPSWKGAKRFSNPSRALYKPCWLPERLQHGATQTVPVLSSIAGILWDRKQRASFHSPM